MSFEPNQSIQVQRNESEYKRETSIYDNQKNISFDHNQSIQNQRNDSKIM